MNNCRSIAFAALLALSATPALAQTTAAPGVCILFREQLFGDSTVGRYVGERLRTIREQGLSGLKAEQTQFETDVKAFNQQRATLAPAAAEQRGRALEQRLQQIQAKETSLQKDLVATEQAALSRILSEASPIVMDLAKQTGCGAVVDGKTVFVFLNNPSMNLTDATIQKLNAKITQFPVERATSGSILSRPAPK